MSASQTIRFHAVKVASAQAIAGMLAAFAIPPVLGIDVPMAFRCSVAVIAALVFAGFSVLFSRDILVCTIAGDSLANDFPALGRGVVRLNRARRSRMPDFFFVRLVDADGNASALIPRPFSAESPEEVRRILRQVKS